MNTQVWNHFKIAKRLAMCALMVLHLRVQESLGFVFPQCFHGAAASGGRITNLLASGNTVPDSSVLPIRYPVLTRIAGVDWEGRCRYVNDELIPASFELTGGIRFDINENIVNMNSFVAFPNGKSREIEMRYVKFVCGPPSIFCRVPTHANDPDPDNQSNRFQTILAPDRSG